MKTQTVEEIGSPSIPTLTRLLIVEDSPHDVDLVLFELREAGFRVQHTVAKNQEEFRAVYKNSNFDAVLSDFRLPGWTGLDVLEEIRAAGDDVPFLLVTGTLGEEAAVECIKQGVSDYILKDRLSRLPVALQRALTERALRQHSEKTQIALAQSEARARHQFAELDMLYRTAPICLAVLDHDLRYLRVNDALAANHRLAPADFVGRHLEEMVPDRAAETAEFYRKVFATGKPILNVETRVNRAYEPFEPRDYLASFYPLTTSEGLVEAACVVMVDITDRKRAEEELHRSEARNRDLVAYSLYGICRAGIDGSFLDANPALLRILGMESWDQLRDLNLVRDVFRFPEQFVRLLASCRTNSQTQGAETEWRRRDGGIVAMRLHLRRFSLAGEPEKIGRAHV